jgi:hypothetical protein
VFAGTASKMPGMHRMIRYLRAFDGLADGFGWGKSGFTAEALATGALRQAGRSAFQDRSFEGPLQLLLECYGREANLNLFGRFAAKWDVSRCLANLLRLEEEEEAAPAILEEPIVKPIFITGSPRSGTTFLHTLLAQDPSIAMPRCWQTIFPYPAKGARRDTRRRQVQRQLSFFQRLAPEMATLHPLNAESPQECTEITSQVFQSLRFETTHHIPSYQKWIDTTGHLAAYRFHKRFLQHLQHQQDARRWILKCPDHVHALNAIETVYPDCGFVFVHRDPLRVIASAAKLTEVIRSPFARSVDKHEIGRQAVGRTLESAHTMMARTRTTAPERLFHIHYADLVRDPMGVVESLYGQFGVEMTGEGRERMQRFLAGSHQHGTNHYSFEEFGLDPQNLSAQFASYMNHFNVLRESPAWKSQSPARAAIAA